MKLRAHWITRGGTQLVAAERAGFKVSNLFEPDQDGSFLALDRFHCSDGLPGTQHDGFSAARFGMPQEPLNQSIHPVLVSIAIKCQAAQRGGQVTSSERL